MIGLAVYSLSVLIMGGGYRAVAYLSALAGWVVFSGRAWAALWALRIARVMLSALAIVQAIVYGWHVSVILDVNLIAAGLLACWPDSRRASAVWAAGMIATGSRSAWLSAAIAAAAIYLPSAWRRPALVAVLIGSVGLIVIRPETITSRAGTYAEASALFAARPVSGWGVGDYMRLTMSEGGKHHADSMALTIAAEQGIIGLTLAALMIWCAGLSITHTDTRAAMLALAIGQLADYTLTWPAVATLAGIRLAVTNGTSKPTDRNT